MIPSAALRFPRRLTARGFSLIELMIAVAIVAILASVAYPSYEQYVRKARRATAQTALLDVAARQQQFLLDQRRYSKRCDACSAADKAKEVNIVVPQEIAGLYTVHVNVPDAVYVAANATFTASAVPSAALVAKGEKTISLDQLGQKLPNENGYWGK